MAINSRTKGSKNERNVSKLFETWTGKKFSRTPSSGGLRWRNSQTCGDIVCTTEGHLFPFSVETKNYKDINFEHLLYLDDSKIIEFWTQATNDAQRADIKKVPILFMRYNGMPKDLHFVILGLDIWNSIKHYLPNTHRYLKYGDRFVIFRSTTLFKSDYKTIRKKLLTWVKRS